MTIIRAHSTKSKEEAKKLQSLSSFENNPIKEESTDEELSQQLQSATLQNLKNFYKDLKFLNQTFLSYKEGIPKEGLTELNKNIVQIHKKVNEILHLSTQSQETSESYMLPIQALLQDLLLTRHILSLNTNLKGSGSSD